MTMKCLRKSLGMITMAILIAMFLAPGAVGAADPTQAQLESELADIESEIARYTVELSRTKTEKATLANVIKKLQVEQSKKKSEIKQTNLRLNNLNTQLQATAQNITASQAKEKKLHTDTALILRRLNAVDETIIVSLATAAGLSSAYDLIQNYSALGAALNNLLEQTKTVKVQLLAAQEKLEDQKSDTSNLLKIKSIQQQELSASLGEQNQLMTQTKGKESNYQAILTDKQKRAAEIRNRIYELFNTGKQISFGQAVEIAKWVSGLTGVRSAFLLAILTQESNLGKNVGTCNRSGDPPEKSWKVIMKPERDQEPFRTIVGELGLDIDTTPVSCPMRDKNGNQVGWGGAMGPAQFIPSTWMGYRAKVTKLSGKPTANPWDIRDAFLASAIKLKGDGADGTDDGDWKAAMRYFSGSTNTKFRFYGDNVIATTNKYLQDIEDLK